jgi:hypothetical protein
MKALIQRLSRARWTWRQPLTRVPNQAGRPVSDLFCWRKSPDWQTFFDLTDMPGLYEANGPGFSEATLVLFDANGCELKRDTLQAPRYRRSVVNVSSLVPDEEGVGTFCVIHERTPDVISSFGSHLTERGYVSYLYAEAPLRSYVHGNLDAVTHDGATIEMLGGTGLQRREYRLQHRLKAGVRYELAIVNPARCTQTVEITLSAAADGEKLENIKIKLSSGATYLFDVGPDGQDKWMGFRSLLVMARPLIFRFENGKMDVLHG